MNLMERTSASSININRGSYNEAMFAKHLNGGKWIDQEHENFAMHHKKILDQTLPGESDIQHERAKAQAASDRLVNETQRQAKDALEAAQEKAQSILSGAEARGRKYIKAAETEATEKIEQAEITAEELLEQRKREGSAIVNSAKREGDLIIGEASRDVLEYRQWLNSVMEEAGRLYKIQTQSLDAAQEAIHASRNRLESAYGRLAELRNNVLENIKEDGKLVSKEPLRVKSERTKPAIAAPKKKKKAASKSIKKK